MNLPPNPIDTGSTGSGDPTNGLSSARSSNRVKAGVLGALLGAGALLGTVAVVGGGGAHADSATESPAQEAPASAAAVAAPAPASSAAPVEVSAAASSVGMTEQAEPADSSNDTAETDADEYGDEYPEAPDTIGEALEDVYEGEVLLGDGYTAYLDCVDQIVSPLLPQTEPGMEIDDDELEAILVGAEADIAGCDTELPAGTDVDMLIAEIERLDELAEDSYENDEYDEMDDEYDDMDEEATANA